MVQAVRHYFSGVGAMAKLRLYRMDMKYVRDLARVDDNVMSVSPQVEKANRPFVGVVVVLDSRD
jgi:protein AbiQ